MGFQTKEVSSFFSKHLKQHITISGFEIKFFSHYFVVFGIQSSIVNH